MASKERVYAEIEASGKLPVLPEVLLNLLAACDDPEFSLGDIGTIISRDPALSLRVLQLVNSAYYGFRHSFSDIGQAVVYLGSSTIKNLAVTTSVHQVFENHPGSRKKNGDTATFWYHSLLTATLAKRIALEYGGCSAEEAYLAGLLHDVGKRLLGSAFGQTYSLREQGGGAEEDRLARENQLLGVNHCEVGSWLIRKWHLGTLVADTVEYHHEPVDQVAEAFPLVRYVYLANVLARDGAEREGLGELAGRLVEDETFDFTGMLSRAIEEVEKISADMGIAVKPPPKVEAADDGLDSQDPSPAIPDLADTARFSVAARVRNMSLLFGFQDELMAAANLEAILACGEKALLLLFDIDNLLFFLPNNDRVLLCGRVSELGNLHEQSRGLTFPLRQSTSWVVDTFQNAEPGTFKVMGRNGRSLADQQILSMFGCDEALVVPMAVGEQRVGAVVLTLPAEWNQQTDDEQRLLFAILQQVALRLHLEQERSRKADLLERERLKAISTTARKLAHEINNPLGIIGNYLMTLRLKLADESGVAGDLAILEEELEGISTMVGQRELYAQAPFSRFEPLDVNMVIKDIIQIAKPAFFSGGGPTISFIPGNNLPQLTTSKDAIKQVLINLLKNGAEAMSEAGGRVIVRTRKVEPEGFSVPGGVEIIVADSGPGLPENVRKNLFQPFVTTKQNGHSGLGLSIVHKVVSDIGGRLTCQTSPTEGTTFTIALPGRIPESEE